MYEIVYSRGKSLKDDNRLAYYSFFTVVHYSEVIYLGLFSMVYTAASGLDMALLHKELAVPGAATGRWPFVRYA